MNRLITTTALALVVAAPVFAQSSGQSDADAQQGDQQDRIYMEQAAEADILGTEFIGQPIYAVEQSFEQDAEITQTTLDDWEQIGEISDVVMTREGDLKAVLADVGGFLGIGEKTVAVSMDDLRFVRHKQSGDLFLVVRSDRAALENAPEFDRGDSAFSAREAAATLNETAGETQAAASQAADETAQETGEAAESAGDMAENAAESVADAAESAYDETAEAADEAADEVAQAASTAGEEAEKAADRAGDDAAKAAGQPEREGEKAERQAQQAQAQSESQSQGQMQGDASGDEGGASLNGIAAEEIRGMTVVDVSGEEIGEVEAMTSNRVIIDVGGFLGLGEHRVALPMDQVEVGMGEADADEPRLTVRATREELEAMPEYEE